MNERWIKLGFCWMAFMCSLVTGYAANYDNPVEGKLAAVYSDHISMAVDSKVSKSADANQTSNGLVDIKVDSQTNYDNFNRLSELKIGDPIRVEYKEPFGDFRQVKKTALMISRLTSRSTTTTTTTTTTTATEASPMSPG